jgi:serine/threonine protein kinase
MSEKHACPECGNTLSPDAPGGLCPRCLIGAAFDSTVTHRGPGRPAVDASPGRDGLRVDLAEFCRAVTELGVVDTEVLRRYADAADGDVTGLAQALVQSGKLTPYQAGAVIQGKARGLVIGGYLVQARLGVGGMGVVFRARHLESGREVALKILPPSFGRERDAVLRFRREFELTAALSHPNLVSAIEADEDRGVQFLTMEYIAGHNLEDLVNRGGPLPLELALHSTIQAARGLEAAHARWIIHRDIKPANLMLDPCGTVRVLDLGLAKVIEATTTLGRTPGGTLTQTGAYMGTVDFLAPEQADDARRADHRADIYSLGCTLYFLLAGRPPFPGDTLLKRLMAHQERPAPSLQAVRPEVNDLLEAAYQRMMAKRPADRFQTMTEVIDRLEACRGSARAAGDASADLKTFARTVFKRAQPKGKIRDTSIFAPTQRGDGLTFDPSLNWEDLVGDYRDEAGHDEIAEEKLPPRPVRPPAPVRRKSCPRVPWPLTGLVAAVALLVAAIVLFPRGERLPHARPAPPRSATVSRPAPRTAPKSNPTDDFRPLFTGNDLSGWTTFNGKLDDWTLSDGVLESRPHNRGAAFLATRQAYDDFVLTLELQTVGDANGGIMLMTDGAKPDDPNCTELIDIQARRTGLTWLWGDGGPFRKVEVPTVNFKPEGQWNGVTIERRGGKITTWVNGQKIHNGFDQVKGSRWIGFQNYPKTGLVRYRKAMIKDLSGLSRPPARWVPLFNDKDLTGWTAEGSKLADWRLADGVLSTKGSSQVGKKLVSERNESEFLLRLDFQLERGTDSGLVLIDSSGSVAAYTEINLASLKDPFRETGTLYFSTDRQLNYRVIAPEPGTVALKPGQPWDSLEVEMRGGRLGVSFNGRKVQYAETVPQLKGPFHIGLQAYFGTIRFRNVEIQSIAPASAALVASMSATTKGNPIGRRLFFDDFTNPSSGFGSDSVSMGRGSRPMRRGYDNGTYFIEAPERWAGASAWDCLGHPEGDIQVEAVGRVFGAGLSPGGWGLIVVNPDSRGFQIGIAREGTLSIAPAFWGREKFPNDPGLGPIAHPAIKAGQEWNTLTIKARKNRLEVLVNGKAVHKPIEFDWDLTPAKPQIVLYKPDYDTRIRAEFDKVEVRTLPPEPAVSQEPPARLERPGTAF